MDLPAVGQRDLGAFVAMRDVVGRIDDGRDDDVLRLAAREAIDGRRVIHALPLDAMTHEAGAGGGGAAFRIAA